MASTWTATRRALETHGGLPVWIRTYDQLHIDIGTGDGTYALHLARQHPGMAVIGIDTCLDNIIRAARRPMENLRFVSCNATGVPEELHGIATSLSINFPYGSLLHAVIGTEPSAWERLLAPARPGALIEIRVNTSAGAGYGLSLEEMQGRIRRMLRRVAPQSATITVMPHHALRRFPTTWAKRIAYGKPSEVIVATASLRQE